MWVEVLVLAVVVSAVLARIGSRRTRRGAAGTSQLPGGAGASRWISSGPIDAAFPVERTPRERDIGDAAFVDGLVVGRYLLSTDPPAGRSTLAGGTRGGVGSAGGEGPCHEVGDDLGEGDGLDDGDGLGTADGVRYDDGGVGDDLDDGYGGDLDDGYGDDLGYGGDLDDGDDW